MRLWLLILAIAWTGGAVALELPAVTEWGRRVELGTPLSSVVVSEIRVSDGQRVSKGQALVLLDDRAHRARVAEAEAGLEEARQDRAESQRELDRALDLYERTVLSQHELQVAEIGAARAEAAYRRAFADLTQARIDLELTRVQAPFDALVLAVFAQPGQALVNGLRSEPLVALAEAGRMRVRGLATDGQLRGVRVGDPVQVLADGRPLDARVVNIGLEPSGQSPDGEALYPLEAELDLPADEPWRAGRRVTLKVGD